MWRVQYSTAQYSTVQLVAADKFGGWKEEEEEEEEKMSICWPTLLSEGAWVKREFLFGSGDRICVKWYKDFHFY